MNIRHGDLALIGGAILPGGLTPSDNKVLFTGSGGNPHSFNKGAFYPCVDGQTVGFLVAGSNCSLFHKDHGKGGDTDPVKIAPLDADTYRVVRQIEQTHEGLRPVED
jgi:hypothetical protein